MIIKGPGRFGSWWASGDHPNNSISENGQNTEKSPGDNIQSQKTIGQENHVTCLKLRLRWNFVPRFLESIPWQVFSINTSSSNSLSLFSQPRRILEWKEHFENLLGISPKSTITLPLKLFIANKTTNYDSLLLNAYLTKINSGKAEDLIQIFIEVWKQGNIITYFSDYATLPINKIPVV